MLDKAIRSGREHRRPYRGAKAIDRSCRNHGDDPWDRDNRLHTRKKRKLQQEDEYEEYEECLSTQENGNMHRRGV